MHQQSPPQGNPFPQRQNSQPRSGNPYTSQQKRPSSPKGKGKTRQVQRREQIAGLPPVQSITMHSHTHDHGMPHLTQDPRRCNPIIVQTLNNQSAKENQGPLPSHSPPPTANNQPLLPRCMTAGKPSSASTIPSAAKPLRTIDCLPAHAVVTTADCPTCTASVSPGATAITTLPPPCGGWRGSPMVCLNEVTGAGARRHGTGPRPRPAHGWRRRRHSLHQGGSRVNLPGP